VAARKKSRRSIAAEGAFKFRDSCAWRELMSEIRFRQLRYTKNCRSISPAGATHRGNQTYMSSRAFSPALAPSARQIP
jgi:hypothetical protein